MNTSSNNDKSLLWLRAETKPFEHRTPVTPQVAGKLVAHGYDVMVERSAERCFDDAEYAAAGCELVATHAWHGAPRHAIIIGLKELDPSEGQFDRRHVHFAHVFKDQFGWQDTLTQFRDDGGVLFDLEYLTDGAGRRVAAFGYWAGFVGAAVALLAYCAKVGNNVLQPLDAWSDKQALLATVQAELEKVQTRPCALVIGALGRCGSGANELFAQCDVSHTGWDQAETAKGGPFDELRDHDIVVNCVFINSPLPPFTTLEHLEKPHRQLQVVCDVSCDPFGQYNPLPIYKQCTTMDAPVTEILTGSDDQPSLHLVAIDHLPALLPRESSDDFSNQLLNTLLDIDRRDSGVWQRAEEIYEYHVSRLTGED